MANDTVDARVPAAQRRARLLELQSLLLPAVLPTVGCTEAAAAYRAHNHELDLGGDWYDLIDRPDDNSIVAIVGDVVGHGVEEIGVMGQLRSASNALCGPCIDPHEILASLDQFARSVPGAPLATVAVLVLDGTRTARYAAAGHPPPIHVRSNGETEIIDVGLRAPLTFGGSGATATFEVDVDDLIVMYTDGVVERRHLPFDDQIAALARFVSERTDRSCADIADAVVDEFGSDATDDQAVMVLRPRHHRGDRYDRPHRIGATAAR